MTEFPIGAVIDGRFEITEHLHGDDAYGVFRARRLGGAPYRGEASPTYLVTTVIALKATVAEFLAQAPNGGLELEGVFEIESAPPLAGRKLLCLVEKEPSGVPSTDALPLPPAEAYALAISLIDEVERLGLPSEQRASMHPALVYVGPKRRFSGAALRWRSFFYAAKRPCHGTLMPFCDVMSPEEAAGGAPNETSHTALVTQCLVYWLTGEPAYDTDGPLMMMVAAIMGGQHRELEVPDSVSKLVEIGLSPDPRVRPPLSLMRRWLVDSLAKELGRWGERPGPGGIPRSEFRDLVFYALQSDQDEPSEGTESLCLADFSRGTGEAEPIPVDFAPRMMMLDRDYVLEKIQSALATDETDSTQIAPLRRAQEWIESRPEYWIAYQLEPKELAGTGAARRVLLERESR